MNPHLDRVLGQLSTAHAEGAFGNVSLGDHVRTCETCLNALTLALAADGYDCRRCVLCGLSGRQHSSGHDYLPDLSDPAPERASRELAQTLAASQD